MSSTLTFNDAVSQVKAGKSPEDLAVALLKSLSTEEKLSLLDGDEEFWPGLFNMMTDKYNVVPAEMGQIKRLGIPGVGFSDGPRGIVMGHSTAFPVSMARGAPWDVHLEEKVAYAIGLEGRAQGANHFGGICVNLPRHPAWGRIQESYSEDPIQLDEIGAAATRGVQKNLMGCAKHFALNSMENARFQCDVEIDDAALHEVYLAHFKRIVDEGVYSIMSSYNSVNGEWAGQNKTLLTDILKEQWGFKGFVMSDFAFDIEAPFIQQRRQYLPKALEDGVITETDIDRADQRILATQLRYYVSRDQQEPDASVVFSQAHRNLAREVAAKSMVLLQNNNVNGKPLLPLEKSKLSSCAVIGRFANASNTGDKGSSKVRCPSVVSPYEGIKSALVGIEVILEDSDSVTKAIEVASNVDVPVLIVGYNHEDEGEFFESTNKMIAHIYGKGDQSSSVPDVIGGDRKSLRLRSQDVEIIEAVTKANPRTIVCVVTAGAVIMEEWRSKAPAILQSWYSGCEGGHALADVLLGRLPYSVAKQEDHLPFFDRNAKSITYDRWFGQRLLDRPGVEAAFSLGFGLSYKSFEIGEASVVTSTDPCVSIQVKVTNTGSRDGRHVVQVYGSPQPAMPNFPKRVLLGFSPVEVASKQSKDILIATSLQPLRQWIDGGFKLTSRNVRYEIGGYSGDPTAVSLNHEIGL